MAKIVQTAGRDQLGSFAPEFAHYNDDVLFGENWNNGDLDLKTRSIITVVALMSQGITDSSIKYHIQNAKNNGKAWAVFNLAKEIYNDQMPETSDKDRYQNSIFFPIGEPNPYGEFFEGQSYLAPVTTEQIPVFNVTFEPGCKNHWHIHHASKGGGQMLICVGGRGYYQEWGKEPVEMTPGTVINIPANIKHWHGAADDSWFSHLAIEIAGEEASTEWCEKV